ncbi:leucine-rich repeat-containing protein 20 isoform X1 [Pteropus medius]|uniref:leucine-rich repeat-containing protein 20 isoform X1 n=1 Tax=Pteropus vampyrus TaxID=132908 RepID=UPI00196AA385|nr:leucine-rich repeat-containing protein 20 isoform X1 [Pteropus giganteus]XP_039727955.1 leucine-rich repeat-containing protein 20 isoform X1 [Pteropus giganteus]XP_039727956.1 leucine-rich repeat-containing protein 20 isoform X1 [Pteropus giganteus]XP_039727957.1 leucine-rich repeat-containing protein 20 isoform X1 [Pteropus giganteus]
MLRKMGEAVARVARKVNETVESGSDTLDLAECKLASFPIGIYKVLRNVTDQIHLITLANNELKSLTSKFMTTFCQLRELRLEGNFLHRLPSEVSTLQHLKAIDLSRNQFHDFPEQLTTLPALETINLEENEIVVSSADQQQCGHHLGACSKFRTSGSTFELLNQKLSLSKTSSDFDAQRSLRRASLRPCPKVPSAISRQLTVLMAPPFSQAQLLYKPYTTP